MKKILAILLVALMLVGMLPMAAISAAAADEVSVKITFDANKTNRTSFSANSQVWQKDGLTFTNDKASSSSAVADYSNPVRLYQGSKVTIEHTGMTKIVITSDGTAKYKTALENSLKGAGYSYTNSGNAYTITLSPAADSVTFSLTAQARFKDITVTASVSSGDDACTHPNAEQKDAVAATCLTAGYEAGVYCPDCRIYTEGGSVIAALGHAYSDWTDVTVATCTEAGQQKAICANCQDEKTQTVAALGHIYVDGTCTGCGHVAVMTNYELVTDATSLKAGDQIVLVGIDKNGAYSVMMAYTSGNNLKPESISAPAEGKIELADTSAAAILTLGGDADGWTLFDGAKYLYAPGKASDNYLKATAELPEDNTGAWTITIDENGLATITNVGNTGDGARNTIFFNYGNMLFAAYKADYSQNASKVSIYRLATGETEEPEVTEPEVTEPEVTEPEVTEPEVTECAHSYVNNVCIHCGAEFEGEIDTPDPTEPEASEPVSSEATIDFSTKDQRVSQDANAQVWANGGATLTNNKAASTTNVADYANPARFYKSSDLVIEFAGMTKIVFTCSSADYAKALSNSISDSSVAVSVSGSVVTVTLSAASNSYTISLTGGQVRMNSLTVYAEASDCAHQWGEWVETTAPTCTETGVQTATCALCGDTKTQTVDATGHSYTYADGAMTCTCGDSVALNTIAEAKAYTSTSKVYYVKGIVTYVSGRNVYIEDATGALCVYFAANASDIALGDEIVVWDTMTKYNGLIETTNTETTEILKLSTGNELPLQVVTLAQLKADTTNEYLGERVLIENVTLGVLGTNNTALTDAEGNSINIYKLSGQSADLAQNDIVNVTAIVSTYNGYQLAVNPGTAATDIVKLASGDVEEIQTVTIAEAKAGTAGDYFQVEGVVSYISGRNVYIQDATGAIVVYLTANASTTKVGDTVRAFGALKNYNGLLELDAVDESNAMFYEIISSGNAVEAKALTIAELNAATGNTYLAELVTLSNVRVSYYSYNDSYKNVTYTLIDDAGNTIKINRVAVNSEEDCIPAGALVNLEANVSAYVTDTTEGNGYQLVTDNAKIEVLSVCNHETTELVNFVQASCGVAGYTGDVQCTVCKYYVSRGEDVAALEHDFQGVVTDPTCTEQGYTTYTCVHCGEVDGVEDYVEATGHSYVEGKCDVCGEADPDYEAPVVLPTAKLRFSNVNIRLEADLTISFGVKPEVFAEGAYENPRVVYSIPDILSGTVRTQEVTEFTYNSQGRLMFAFNGISPRMMKAPITCMLYGTYQGVEYSYEYSYQLSNYCYGQLNNQDNASNTMFLTLLADLLNFGTAHQKYANHELDNLINAEMTETHQSYASKYDLALTDLQTTKYEVIDNPTTRFASIGLSLQNAVVIRYTMQCDDITDASLKVIVEEKDGKLLEYDIPASEWVPVENTTNRYTYEFSKLMAKHMSCAVYAKMCKGDVATSNTFRYSIETYAYRTLADTKADADLKNLLTYMMYYGNSAAAYFTN